MSPHLIITSGSSTGRHLARRHPGAIIANAQTRTLMRDGASVGVSRQVFLLVVALAGRPGTLVSSGELQDLLFGTAEDGGPDNGLRAVATILNRARIALLALGCRIETEWGRGWHVRFARGASAAREVA